MEDSASFLNLFADHIPRTAVSDARLGPNTDLALLFSSPATDTPEGHLHSHFQADPNLFPIPFPPLTPRQEASTNLDALLGPTTTPMEYQHHAHHRHVQTHVDDMVNQTSLSSPTFKQENMDFRPSICGSDDESFGRPESFHKVTSRTAGGKRELDAMRSVADKNAPNVSLSDVELLKISSMHESEAHLAESRELYSTLTTFKKCFAKHGYRLKSIALDVMSAAEREMPDFDDRPLDFILDKDPAPVRPDSVGSELSGSDEEVMMEVGTKRSSFTMSATTSSVEGDSPAIESEERPRKRSRTCGKAEHSTCPSSKRLSCAVCTRKMSDLGNLVRHFRHVHQERKPFMCPKCGGYYSSEGTLWHHISNVHTDSRRTHKCEFCDASYDSSGAKTRHVNGTHHGQKPTFFCGYQGCDRSFVFPAHLERHAITEHEGYKPFECSQCAKAFSSCNGLTRHEREVHRTEKAYTCPICENGITKRCHLKRHLQNVHRLPEEAVEEEMKKHPNPADLSAITNSRFSA